VHGRFTNYTNKCAGQDGVPKVKVMLHPSSSKHGPFYCWFVVGSIHDDALLLSRHLDIGSCSEPIEFTVGLNSKPVTDTRVVAAILSANVIGSDVVSTVEIAASKAHLKTHAVQQAHRKEAVNMHSAAVPASRQVHAQPAMEQPPSKSGVLRLLANVLMSRGCV
jgi:hypothetical protein